MSSICTDEMWPNVDRFIPPKVLALIQENAASADRNARVTGDTLASLKECKYFGSVVPETLGGGGASLLECAAMQRRVAQYDVGLAVGLVMHTHTVAGLNELSACGDPKFIDLLKGVASKQHIVLSAGSEKGLGGAVARSSFESLRTKGGYLISGNKTPVSFARLGKQDRKSVV